MVCMIGFEHLTAIDGIEDNEEFQKNLLGVIVQLYVFLFVVSSCECILLFVFLFFLFFFSFLFFRLIFLQRRRAMTDRYSFSLTTFSPSGKLVQIEYALNAVNAGSTCVGIKATNGVVVATEKKLPFLMDQNSFEKVSPLTRDVGVV